MLEVMNNMLRLAGNERCIVWVCSEVFFTSDDASVIRVRGEMTCLCKVIYECISLLSV